jgi:hypothetical protein
LTEASEDAMRRPLVTLLAFAAPAFAHADVIPLRVVLTPAAEVPPVTNSGGHGEAALELDTATRRLTWHVTYDGLTGHAFVGHLHGPATETVNAPVIVPFPLVASPIDGAVTLSEAQMADLLAGRWYVNIHTRANEAGEIRGQIRR